MCARACVRACVCVRKRVCVRARVCALMAAYRQPVGRERVQQRRALVERVSAPATRQHTSDRTYLEVTNGRKAAADPRQNWMNPSIVGAVVPPKILAVVAGVE